MKSSRSPKEEAFDPQVFLAKVADGQTVTNYIERQAVFAQGDPADSIFYIHGGKVKVTVLSNQGKEAVVAILGSGQFFGEGCLAGQTHRLYSVIADPTAMIEEAERASLWLPPVEPQSSRLAFGKRLQLWPRTSLSIGRRTP